MSNETNERLKRDTQHVPLRQNTEEKVRGKGLKAVWDDTNERNTEWGCKTEKKGPKVLKSGLSMLSPLSNRPHPSNQRNTKNEGNETGPFPLEIH